MKESRIIRENEKALVLTGNCLSKVLTFKSTHKYLGIRGTWKAMGALLINTKIKIVNEHLIHVHYKTNLLAYYISQ